MILTRSLKKRQLVAGAFFATVAGLYIFFPLATTRQTPIIFNSPDETANYFFAKRWASEGSLSVAEPLNALADNVIHPRSITVRDGALVPASFVGLPLLYGSIALFSGAWVIPYLTALFTIAALLAFYACTRRYFGDTIASLAVALAAVHPALWYFTSRGLYHNVLFFDLLVIAWWCYETMFEQKKATRAAEWLLTSGCLLVAAIVVRTSELLWVLPLVAASVYQRRREWHSNLTLVLFAFLLMTLAGAIFFLSSDGSLLGYHIFSAAGLSLAGRLWYAGAAIFFPFGFHPLNIIQNFVTYALLLFWPFTALILVGVFSSDQKQFRTYMRLALWVTFSLAVYYGSARITDSIGTDAASIGNSFVRYWIPLYLVWMPFAASGFVTVARLVQNLWRHLLGAILFLVLVAWSFQIVFFDRTEGLTYVAERMELYARVRVVAEQVTGNDAVIISDQSDKLFFPGRRVITPGDRPVSTYPEVLSALPRLADAAPLYMYLEGPPSATLAALYKTYDLAFGRPLALPNGARLYPLIHL